MYQIGAVADLIRQQAGKGSKSQKRLEKPGPADATAGPPKPLYVEYKPLETESDSHAGNRKRKRKVSFAVDEDGDSDKEQTSVPTKKHAEDTPERLARTIFVGNLSSSTSAKALKRAFSNYGSVESLRFRSAAPARETCSKKIAAINRKLLNENKKTLNAYIVFRKAESVAGALTASGTVLNGNHICVDRVDQKAKFDERKSVFVGNLPLNVTDEDLWKFFEECGTVKSVRVVRDRDTGIGKGFGFVRFAGMDSVALALEMSGSTISDREIRVMPVEKKKKKITTRKGGNVVVGRTSKKKDAPSQTDFQGARAERLARKKKLKKVIKAKMQMKKTKILFGAQKGKRRKKKSAEV